MEKSKEARSKAEQIRAFLESHQPKLPEARGFLQFLLAKEEILRRTELIPDLALCDNAILVTAKGAGGWPFFYKRGNRFFHKTSQAVVELMKYVPEPLYLCLSTRPAQWSEERQVFLDQMAAWREELFADCIHWLDRKFDLLRRIDRALDEGDQEQFIELTGELRRLESSGQ